MKQDRIEKEFFGRAIIHRRIYLFYPGDALDVIKRCQDLKREIYGIDAFLTWPGGKIQPVMAQSVDYTSPDNTKLHPELNNSGHWEEAILFIKERMNEEYVFEIVYERGKTNWW